MLGWVLLLRAGLGAVASCWVMLRHAGSCWVMLGWVMLGHAGSGWIMRDHAGSGWVMLGDVGSCWVMLKSQVTAAGWAKVRRGLACGVKHSQERQKFLLSDLA